jgi:drug/metabolite transporter (DMT)-like permease
VVVLHERLTVAAVCGIVATVAGVMIAVLRTSAAPDPRESSVSVRTPAIGAVSGLVAALCYGVGGFLIGRYTVDLGWLVPVVVARGGALLALLGLLAMPLRKPAGTRVSAGIGSAVAAGVADAAGLVFFTRGDQVGLVAVAAAVSSACPLWRPDPVP